MGAEAALYSYHFRTEADTRSGGAVVNLSLAESNRLLSVITDLNLIRMSLEMYPPGHTRIKESIDYTFGKIQKIFREKAEIIIGFAGDSLTFGETASEKEKKNVAFREYARCLNNLRIVSFTLHRSVNKDELAEFNRIISAKPSDVWALGNIDAVFARAGIKGIKVKAIGADHFRLAEKKETTQAKTAQKAKDEYFWQDFLAHLKSDVKEWSLSSDMSMDEGRMDPAEIIHFLNKQREQWPSAIFSYERMLQDYFSETQEGERIDHEKYEALANVNALVGNLHPELKKQLMEVVERQLTLHSDAALTAENLKYFPHDIFMEIIRETNERKSQISPALVNFLKKMASIRDVQALPDRAVEMDFSSKDMEILLQREAYEKYVPEDYNSLLKKAAGTCSAAEDANQSQFPLHEYLKTFSYEYVDSRICQLTRSLMDEEIVEDDYLACSKKLARSTPDLLKAGQFPFLTTLMETLRRHIQDKPMETLRQEALSLLRSMMDKETIAKFVAPFILKDTAEPSVLTPFLISSGVQNLTWLFDLYLDPNTTPSTTLAEIIRGFGTKATDEALRRLAEAESHGIVRLLTFIRTMNDRSVASSLKRFLYHKEWSVRKEVIKTFIQFDDPSVVELLRKSLKADDLEEVLNAVSLSCRHRIDDLLEDVTAMLKTSIISDDNATIYEWVIGELVKTGHPSVIPHLERIAATSFTFSPQHLSRMKIVIYRNIRRFPKNRVLNLLKIGIKSNNSEIRIISSKLLKHKG